MKAETWWRNGCCVAWLVFAIDVLAKDKPYEAPRLADGHPNLQGIWTQLNATPLERPDGVNTLVISSTQAAQIEERMMSSLMSGPGDPTILLIEKHIEPIRGELRSSIVVEPASGKIPGNSFFRERMPKMRSAMFSAFDGPEQRPASERCLGNPSVQAPILSIPGSNVHSIVQDKDNVIFVSEMMHEARIIRLNATHRPAAITTWAGDSIGWWEGDTLAVETKYFTQSDTARIAPFIDFLVSPQTTVQEWFKRVSDDELSYEFTVTDPTYYTQTWKGETNFRRSDWRLGEYSCHEGNHSLLFMLRAGRVQDGQWPPKSQTE